MPDIREFVPETNRDLLETCVSAAVTTIGADGFAQTTAVRFLLDDDGRPKFTTTSNRRTCVNLRRDPHCRLFVVDPANQYRTLELRAIAVLSDPDKAFGRRIAPAHGADPSAPVRRDEDRYDVILEPARVVVVPPAG